MQDYSEVQGAFLYKVCSFAFNVINDWYQRGSGGWNAGITKQCVDQYLAKDGKPVEISSLTIDPKSMNSLGENKDPRFGESVWYPAKGTFTSFYDDDIGTHAYNTTMPGLIKNQQDAPSLSGYRIWKGIVVQVPVQFKSGETDILIMRYGEALLNYIEAKSLLGSITQSDIDKTVNVLRSRAGMALMNLGEVNSWAITYNAKDGYDVEASNIVNEIRRERRVELLLEGFRSQDIKRWALMNEVYNEMKPKGAYLQEFLDYWNDPAKLAADGFVQKKPADVVLTPGSNCESFEDGYINPFFIEAEFRASGSGYFIDPARDYLDAIPKQEIKIYETKGGVSLEQNPGWF